MECSGWKRFWQTRVWQVAIHLPDTRWQPPDEGPILPVWVMPQGAGYAKRSKMWLDFQNDVKVSDVQLAAQEGYE